MESVWEQTREAVQGSMDPDGFQRWIAPLRFVGSENGTILIDCPNAFFKDWVERHHRSRIEQALRKISGDGARLQIQIRKPTGGRTRRTRDASDQFFGYPSFPSLGLGSPRRLHFRPVRRGTHQ